MIRFLISKMWKNKWVIICLLIGNLLLLGTVSATPLYINATMRRILHQDLRQYQIEHGEHPARLELLYVFNNTAAENRLPYYFDTRTYFARDVLRDLGVTASISVRTDTLDGAQLLPTDERDARVRRANITGIQHVDDHINLTRGRMPADELVGGDIVEVIASEAAMLRHGILFDDVYHIRSITARDVYIRVVGTYELAEGSEYFWAALEHDHLNHLIASHHVIMHEFVVHYSVEYRITTRWIHLLDYQNMHSRDVSHYLAVMEEVRERFHSDRWLWEVSENFTETIALHETRAGRLAITLWVLQVPIYVLLAFYIFMVSRQILKLDQNEVSILKSRGAPRKRIIGLYIMQGGIIAAICYPVGLVIGMALCRLLGASSGFLDLVQRTAIIVEITPDVLLITGLAMLLSFTTMLAPVIRFSKVGIVEHKRKRGKTVKPMWQRLFLDVLCLGVAVYSLYTFNEQRDVMAAMIREGQSVDPLLFLSSSLFILGLGLFCLRLFPYMVRLIYRIGHRFWSPATYASLLRVIRTAGEEQFIMIFLLFTLSIGTFSAQAARTINLNNDHQIQYLAGADLIFREAWRSEIPFSGEDAGRVTFIEPNFERFTHFEEVDTLTRVRNQVVNTTGGTAISDVRLMAIEPYHFGNTLWFRNDLLYTHVNHYLNVLAARPDGVLLSRNFQTMGGYSLNDTIRIDDGQGGILRAEVLGFVDFWPGFAPIEVEVMDGQAVQLYQSLVVANLSFVQNQWGLYPYQVWMRTNTDTNTFFHDFVTDNRINIVEFTDAKANIVQSRNAPILQGTNGVLTVGFLVTLAVCFTGFLLYWMLSIRARVLQFGIFRAMGMRRFSLFEILLNEQFLVTFSAILLGAAVGEISARLFVPLIQVSYSAAEQVIPLMIVNEMRDYANLYAVVGVMVIICLVALTVYVSRIKIAQVLKLGED